VGFTRIHVISANSSSTMFWPPPRPPKPPPLPKISQIEVQNIIHVRSTTTEYPPQRFLQETCEYILIGNELFCSSLKFRMLLLLFFKNFLQQFVIWIF
jgi:hypothetical protein